MNGPQAYQRAADLLEQAFETNGLGPKLTEETRLIYVGAAQAYAALAQTAAIANHQSGESSTSLAEEPSGWDARVQVNALTWAEVLR